MPDAAQFRQRDIMAIWGERPRCPFTGQWQFVEGHHILGRGYAHGANKKSHDRKMFSSIYNFFPLQRDIHKGGLRDHPLMRRLMLDITRRKVHEAMRDGRYEQTPLDSEFIIQAFDWIDQNKSWTSIDEHEPDDPDSFQIGVDSAG